MPRRLGIRDDDTLARLRDIERRLDEAEDAGEGSSSNRRVMVARPDPENPLVAEAVRAELEEQPDHPGEHWKDHPGDEPPVVARAKRAEAKADDEEEDAPRADDDGVRDDVRVSEKDDKAATFNPFTSPEEPKAPAARKADAEAPKETRAAAAKKADAEQPAPPSQMKAATWGPSAPSANPAAKAAGTTSKKE